MGRVHGGEHRRIPALARARADDEGGQSGCRWRRPAPSTAVAPAAAASDPNWRMVVLVGTDHVRGRVGVPDRVTRRTGLSTFTMVPLSCRGPIAASPPSTGRWATRRRVAALRAATDRRADAARRCRPHDDVAEHSVNGERQVAQRSEGPKGARFVYGVGVYAGGDLT